MCKKLGLLFLVLALVAGGALVGCGKSTDTGGDSGDSSDVIKIGVFEPMTGANAAGGEMTVEGIKLANETKGEVLGKKVELVIVDNKSDKVEAANAVSRLIEKDKVVAIIGSYGSSLSMAAGDIVKRRKYLR